MSICPDAGNTFNFEGRKLSKKAGWFLPLECSRGCFWCGRRAYECHRDSQRAERGSADFALQSNRRKRKAWSLEQKLFIIQLKDEKPGISLDGLCKCFQDAFQEEIARQTLSDWLQPKNVQKLKEHAHHAVGRTKQSQKRCRKLRLSVEKGGVGNDRCVSLKLETALYLWVKQQQLKGHSLEDNVETVVAKAKQLADHPQLKRSIPDGYDFNAEWHSGFCQRFKLKLRDGQVISTRTTGLANHSFVPPPQQKNVLDHSVSAEIVRERLSAFLQCIPFERFELPVGSENVFALHQIQLMYRQLPTSEAKMAEEQAQAALEAVPDVSAAEKRSPCITIGLAANSMGTEKLPPLVIGSSHRPKAFPRGYNVQQAHGMHYYWNKNSVLLPLAFDDWLWKMNSHYRTLGRRIVLLVDDDLSHVIPDIALKIEGGFKLYSLPYIAVVFLPLLGRRASNVPPNDSEVEGKTLLHSIERNIGKQFKIRYRKMHVNAIGVTLTRAAKNAIAAGLAPGVSNALAGAPPAPDSATKEKFVPTFVEALKWIEVAWEQIPQLVIKNSWCATRLVEDKDANELQIQHQNASSTTSFYQHLLERDLEEATKTLQLALDEVKKANSFSPAHRRLYSGDNKLLDAKAYYQFPLEDKRRLSREVTLMTEEQLIGLVMSDNEAGLKDLRDDDQVPIRPKITAMDAHKKSVALWKHITWHSAVFTAEERDAMGGLVQKFSRHSKDKKSIRPNAGPTSWDKPALRGIERGITSFVTRPGELKEEKDANSEATNQLKANLKAQTRQIKKLEGTVSRQEKEIAILKQQLALQLQVQQAGQQTYAHTTQPASSIPKTYAHTTQPTTSIPKTYAHTTQPTTNIPNTYVHTTQPSTSIPPPPMAVPLPMPASINPPPPPPGMPPASTYAPPGRVGNRLVR